MGPADLQHRQVDVDGDDFASDANNWRHVSRHHPGTARQIQDVLTPPWRRPFEQQPREGLGNRWAEIALVGLSRTEVPNLAHDGALP